MNTIGRADVIGTRKWGYSLWPLIKFPISWFQYCNAKVIFYFIFYFFPFLFRLVKANKMSQSSIRSNGGNTWSWKSPHNKAAYVIWYYINEMGTTSYFKRHDKHARWYTRSSQLGSHHKINYLSLPLLSYVNFDGCELTIRAPTF